MLYPDILILDVTLPSITMESTINNSSTDATMNQKTEKSTCPWEIDYEFLRMRAIFEPLDLECNPCPQTAPVCLMKDKPSFQSPLQPSFQPLHIMYLPYKEDERVYQLFVGKHGNNIKTLEQTYSCRLEVRDKARQPHIKIFTTIENLAGICGAIESQLSSARDIVRNNAAFARRNHQDNLQWRELANMKEIANMKKRIEKLEEIIMQKESE